MTGRERDQQKRRGNRFHVHWTPERIIEAIQEWEERYGEIPRRSDWDARRAELLAQAALTKADEWRQRATLFRLGEWPSPRTVTEVFGSWNKAITEAGFTPRQPSQRTSRGADPSPFLIPLGHAIGEVYAAEDSGDVETLRLRLLAVAEVASRLAAELDASEEAIAARIGGTA